VTCLRILQRMCFLGRSNRGIPEDMRSQSSLARRPGIQSLKPPSLSLSVFRGNDFNLWKTDAEFILSLNGHWDVIQDKFKKPKVDSRGHVFLGPDYTAWGTMEDVEEWEILNRQALAILYNALGPDQKQLVSRCKEAAKMWRLLEDTYSRKSHSNLAHILREYNTFRMKKNQTMASYIHEYKGHLDKLRDIDVQLDERVIVLNLLNGLRDEYAVDRKIMSRVDSLSYDEAVGQLLSEALIEQKGGSGAILGNLADGGNQGGRGKGKRTGGGNGNSPCPTCGQTGHKRPNCPKNKADRESGACFICHKQGHRASHCPEKGTSTSGQNRPRANVAQGAAPPTSQEGALPVNK